MVFIKKGGASNKLERHKFVGKLVQLSTDPAAVINEEKKLYKYVEFLFMEIDEDGKIIYQKDSEGTVIKKEDGTDKVQWRSLRIYMSRTNKETGNEENISLTEFAELVKADELLSVEKSKPADEERIWPVCFLEMYKKVNEKDGKFYVNWRASLTDLATFKIVS